MNFLSIDTSVYSTSVAVTQDYQLKAELTSNESQSHSEKIIEHIDKVLNLSQMTLQDMDCFVCTFGPGSFTGLRIGASTIKGFAQIFDKPIIGISVLEAMAYSVPNRGGLLCPMIDAQRDQVYSGWYRWEERKVTRVLEEGIYSVEELLRRADKQSETMFFLGNGLGKFKGKESLEKRENTVLLPEMFYPIKASHLGALAVEKYRQQEDCYTWQNFEPKYFRKSQAEIQREKRMKGE